MSGNSPYHFLNPLRPAKLEARLLEDHVRHCVTDAANQPALLEQRLEEIIALYKRRLA